MVITTAVEPGLPALAWLVECAGGRMRTRCGPAVAVSDHGLFEGCWTGDFPAFDFDRADYVFGTGMRLRDGIPVFVPPSHTLDALYVWRPPAGWCVSNSLAFLCEHCDVGLPFATYGRRFASTVLGIERYEMEIYRSTRGVLFRVVYDRFSVTDGGLRLMRPASEPRITDFASYRAHLGDVLARAAGNAAHGDRKQTYRLLGTCSTGYDSSACAVLASELGCREALTFRMDRTGKSDSGRDVAALLGMDATELQGHGDGWVPDSLSEVEFCVSGLGGDDVVFQQAKGYLPHRLLVTGFHGDSVWDLEKPAVTSIERGDASGSSLGEFRLRLDFIHLPLPFVGCRDWPGVRRISRSEEMLPYRIGGKYDRPIPRRILEEAGVPRRLFGQQKKMVSTLIFIDRTRLSRESNRDFLQQERRIAGARRLYFHFRRGVFHGRLAANRIASRIFGSALHPKVQRTLLGEYKIFEHTHPRSGDAVFLWALERQRRIYRAPPPASN